MRELFNEADNKMYRENLNRHTSGKGSIIHTIKQMLFTRDSNTSKHTDRLKRLMTGFATVAGVAPSEIADLELLAVSHDIGKVGIPDHILNKPGPLAPGERMKMQLHSEIGYR